MHYEFKEPNATYGYKLGCYNTDRALTAVCNLLLPNLYAALEDVNLDRYTFEVLVNDWVARMPSPEIMVRVDIHVNMPPSQVRSIVKSEIEKAIAHAIAHSMEITQIYHPAYDRYPDKVAWPDEFTAVLAQ